ncbi:MAG: hypothetical protein COT89_02790 [Candidatus Colwellbacteria bacterium CG10_big_fil_rev_8_21_14_0_10_42_22]|uniref:DUF4145 domain-containing protein n=1 Tax=Candidatus Colwellbacteria bacterium CG10_big_fil_rev_8_21_14_0_10_42_22 TaxID=1974540 RepID=A0A2H0VFC9_9BACT|nr:MAG: hypothetical protein COT89_02790 [Candidatus Colwellbacteria bacterium CG10_big_fil_rev_8_21_14_0_10_42_22]
MDRLRKQIENSQERRLDNVSKKELFESNRHPQSANYYKEEWSFIKKKGARENIAYQLQYLEFMINLYNDYQIYLTVESLLCKNLMITISSIIESALTSIMEAGYDKITAGTNPDRNFKSMIDLAYAKGIFSRNMKYKLQGLRRVRNSIHLSSIDYQEHVAYEPEDVNNYLDLLDKFRMELSSAL